MLDHLHGIHQALLHFESCKLCAARVLLLCRILVTQISRFSGRTVVAVVLLLLYTTKKVLRRGWNCLSVCLQREMHGMTSERRCNTSNIDSSLPAPIVVSSCSYMGGGGEGRCTRYGAMGSASGGWHGSCLARGTGRIILEIRGYFPVWGNNIPPALQCRYSVPYR